MATKAPLDLPYSVEQWDDADQHVEELIALARSYRIAKAALDRAVQERTTVLAASLTPFCLMAVSPPQNRPAF